MRLGDDCYCSVLYGLLVVLAGQAVQELPLPELSNVTEGTAKGLAKGLAKAEAGMPTSVCTEACAGFSAAGSRSWLVSAGSKFCPQETPRL